MSITVLLCNNYEKLYYANICWVTVEQSIAIVNVVSKT